MLSGKRLIMTCFSKTRVELAMLNVNCVQNDYGRDLCSLVIACSEGSAERKTG